MFIPFWRERSPLVTVLEEMDTRSTCKFSRLPDIDSFYILRVQETGLLKGKLHRIYV